MCYSINMGDFKTNVFVTDKSWDLLSIYFDMVSFSCDIFVLYHNPESYIFLPFHTVHGVLKARSWFDYAKAFDCVDHNKLENSERDGNTRPPNLPPEKSVCWSRSNS